MTPLEDAVVLLRKVTYLAALDDATLAEVARNATRQRFLKGERIVSELESGADVFVVVSGEAEVSVEPRAGEHQVLGKLGPSSAFGEMSSLTGELRSATVTALGDVSVLRISDFDFDKLRERRPEIAVALVRILAARLAGAERAIDALLDEPQESAEGAARAAATAGAHVKVQRGSIARAWRELVVSRKRDLTFLTLAGFAMTLVAVRVGVHFAFKLDFYARDVLRAAYMSGFGLLVVSSAIALLTFRAEWRRAIAIAYGVGLALIFNSLGVTLAFDIFFKDIHTADPDNPFNLEQLYRRKEPLDAIAVGMLVLVQAAYLGKFYRRAAFVIRTKLRKLFSRAR